MLQGKGVLFLYTPSSSYSLPGLLPQMQAEALCVHCDLSLFGSLSGQFPQSLFMCTLAQLKHGGNIPKGLVVPLSIVQVQAAEGVRLPSFFCS